MVNQWIETGWRRALSLLWPSTCLACGAAGRVSLDFCDDCAAELPLNTPACTRCGVLLAGIPGQLCGACIKRLPHYHAAFCAYRYAYPVDHLVRGLKYAQALPHARVLGRLLAEQLRARSEMSWPECFIPVPLSSQRYRERGYNQVIEIGRFVERVTGVRMRTDLVRRMRHTEEQARLPKKKRRKNIRRAFKVEGALPTHVAILDDVVTTGSTVDELARTLARGGAARIEVWAVARVG